ncbi:helix-turn-helix transcriptional regulator [Salmonella enterica subsp. enterica serovar Alachua]|nr:helix-turn-helix transcriptional regulator [Salmonella enterica subsp. enterica serovar Alachua]
MQSPLRKLRNAHGFTLSHVAVALHIDPATLSRIERCQQVPSIELAAKLVGFYQGEINELHVLYPERYPTDDLALTTVPPEL